MSEMAVEQMVSRVIRQVVKISSPEGSHGSGMVVHGELILTALHVVDGAPGLFVRFYSGEAIEADCIAADPTTDLALLRLRQSPRTIPPDQLDAILLEEEKLEPGEIMIAIGHPLGLDWSVTGGHFNAIR
ncbi:MAG: trypsin-like peptidase domain-containing protein, partial [Anaerolineae bacterium]|nr:trypsin-like peptidase domain-containing protein [Anaerolineae bacterium]